MPYLRGSVTLHIVEYEAGTVPPQVKIAQGWHPSDMVYFLIISETRYCYTISSLLVSTAHLRGSKIHMIKYNF